jgi:cell division septation protein DedD
LKKENAASNSVDRRHGRSGGAPTTLMCPIRPGAPLPTKPGVYWRDTAQWVEYPTTTSARIMDGYNSLHLAEYKNLAGSIGVGCPGTPPKGVGVQVSHAPRTPNPKPHTPNPKPQNPKPQTLNPKPHFPKPQNPKPQTPNPKPQTPKPQTPNPKPQNSALTNPKLKHYPAAAGYR